MIPFYILSRIQFFKMANFAFLSPSVEKLGIFFHFSAFFRSIIWCWHWLPDSVPLQCLNTGCKQFEAHSTTYYVLYAVLATHRGKWTHCNGRKQMEQMTKMQFLLRITNSVLLSCVYMWNVYPFFLVQLLYTAKQYFPGNCQHFTIWC